MSATPAPILKPVTLSQIRAAANTGMRLALKSYPGSTFTVLKCVRTSRRYGVCTFTTIVHNPSGTKALCVGAEQVRNLGVKWDHRYRITACQKVS